MRQFMKPERIRIIAVLAIFNYIFLGSEYLFDNMIRYATDSAGVVRAQNYVLGISVIGFLLFPCINRYFNQKMREIGLFIFIAGSRNHLHFRNSGAFVLSKYAFIRIPALYFIWHDWKCCTLLCGGKPFDRKGTCTNRWIWICLWIIASVYQQ